nr:chemotaxis-specific protein-glutamate methyltransferase CheB [Pacificimonas pallii]
MLVDDSGISRVLMARWLDESGAQVVSQASNGREALANIASARPDIVLLDIEMPGKSGIEILPLLREASPQSRIVMVSTLTQRNAAITMEALSAGAVEALAKPNSDWSGSSVAEFRRRLVETVWGICQGSEAAWPVGAAAEVRSAGRAGTRRARPSIVAIGASTGGPAALFSLLKHLPKAPRVPILIAQHMPPMFTGLLGTHLTRQTGISSAEAVHDDAITQGQIYIAPGAHHMSVRRAADGTPRIRITDDPPENFCRPSVNPLFRSVADIYGSAALAIMLTGMGKDGLEGTKAMRAAGAHILAQDAVSSIVWGMPGAIVHEGLADDVLSIEDMGPFVADLVGGS